MADILKPELRDRTIETIITNLIMARLVKCDEVFHYTELLCKLQHIRLARTLVESRVLLDGYLGSCWVLN